MTIAEENAVGAALAALVDGGVVTTKPGPPVTLRTPDPIGRFEGKVHGRTLAVELEWHMRRDDVAFLHVRVSKAETPFSMRAGPHAPGTSLTPVTTGDAAFDRAIRCFASSPDMMRLVLDAETRAALARELSGDAYVEAGTEMLLYRVPFDAARMVRSEQLHAYYTFATALADRIDAAFQAEATRITQLHGPVEASRWMANQAAMREAAMERREAQRKSVLLALGLFAVFCVVVVVVGMTILFIVKLR